MCNFPHRLAAEWRRQDENANQNVPRLGVCDVSWNEGLVPPRNLPPLEDSFVRPWPYVLWVGSGVELALGSTGDPRPSELWRLPLRFDSRDTFDYLLFSRNT